MTLAAFAIAAIVVLAFRIWIETLAQKKRMEQPLTSREVAEPKCYKYCDELAQAEELVANCPKTSRAYKLVAAAASRLAVKRPEGLYRWREQHEVDDLHEQALGFLTEARSLASSC